jgi:hypothetical protein
LCRCPVDCLCVSVAYCIYIHSINSLKISTIRKLMHALDAGSTCDAVDCSETIARRNALNRTGFIKIQYFIQILYYRNLWPNSTHSHSPTVQHIYHHFKLAHSTHLFPVQIRGGRFFFYFFFFFFFGFFFSNQARPGTKKKKKKKKKKRKKKPFVRSDPIPPPQSQPPTAIAKYTAPIHKYPHRLSGTGACHALYCMSRLWKNYSIFPLRQNTAQLVHA